MRTRLLPCLALALSACAGVTLTRDGGPMPRTVAVLPLAGDADPRLRLLCRALLVSGLQQHGLRVAETDHTDRILAEYGWLRDPAAFRPEGMEVGSACAALGVDALAVGTGFDESSFNLLLVRRHSFAGDLELNRADGSRALRVGGSTARTGGFLLQSGQVLSELREQGEHGTPRASVALVDAFVDDVLAALPPPTAGDGGEPAAAMAVALRAADLRLEAGDGGRARLSVRGTVPPGTRVWLDLDPATNGVPARERDGAFSVARDLDAARPVDVVHLRARDGFGGTAGIEVRR